MSYINRGALIVVSIIGTALSACGGGGGGGGATGPTVGGIDGTGTPAPSVVAFGTVSGFGSVIVNGVHYETDSTTFTLDGEVGTQDDLDVGDVVLVRGSLDDGGLTGSADSISFDDSVEGPIGAIDPAAGTLVVLSQLIRISADTSFDDSIQPASLDGLSVGDIVEISGFIDATGVVDATRIEAKPAGGEWEVTGIVSTLNAATSQFNLNSLVVDFSSATLEDFSGGGVSDGDLLEIKGNSLGAMDEFIATRVEYKGDELTADVDDRLEIEGFITRFASATDFDVSGFPVTTNAQTAFEGGVAADLGLNIKVEVEGDLSSSGVLVANKADIRRARAVRVVALVDSVDAQAGSFVTLGITVNVDVLTRVEDKSDQQLEPFGVDQLVAGDYVEVRGTEFPAGSGEILAGRLERDEADNETSLQGFVTGVTQPMLTILGVTIETDGATVFRNADDTVMSATAFFDAVADGSLVKADGSEAGAQVIAADEVELEFED